MCFLYLPTKQLLAIPKVVLETLQWKILGNFRVPKGLWGNNTAWGCFITPEFSFHIQNDFFSQEEQDTKETLISNGSTKSSDLWEAPCHSTPPLSCIFTYICVRTLSVRSLKTEACLNIAWVEIGAKGSEGKRGRGKKSGKV